MLSDLCRRVHAGNGKIQAMKMTLLDSCSFLRPSWFPAAPAMPNRSIHKGRIQRFARCAERRSAQVQLEQSRFSRHGARLLIYVPAQYTPDKPACVYVNQDGVQWQAPVVFDNLIHKKEMPVTIGVFVMHGRVAAADANAALDRSTAAMNTTASATLMSAFLLEELLPEVETKKTADGRAIRLSKNGNDRAIGGSSSGAICAFTAAWERPDAFQPRLQRHWHVRRPARRRPLSDAHSQDGAENRFASICKMARTISTSTAATGGWRTRRWNARWYLRATRCSTSGARSAQRQSRHSHLSRRHALALEGLAPACEGRPVEEWHA